MPSILQPPPTSTVWKVGSFCAQPPMALFSLQESLSLQPPPDGMWGFNFKLIHVKTHYLSWHGAGGASVLSKHTLGFGPSGVKGAHLKQKKGYHFGEWDLPNLPQSDHRCRRGSAVLVSIWKEGVLGSHSRLEKRWQ